jgi:hypothetical protein
LLHDGSDFEPLSQPKFLDHCSWDEWIGTFTSVVVFWSPQEPVTVGMHFEQTKKFLTGFFLGGCWSLGSGDWISFFIQLRFFVVFLAF